MPTAPRPCVFVPVLALSALLAAACGTATPPGAALPSPPPTGVSVVTDLPYAAIGPDPDAGWNEPLLDVYRPAGAGRAPVVVLFHGGPDTNRKDTQALLARDLATAGMVVFVPTWGSGTHPAAMAGSIGAERMVAAMEQWRREGSCAVSYAVAHAAEHGGDPSRLLLFGFSGGANEAGAVGVTGPEAFAGCLTKDQSWRADRLVLWEGDWLLANESYWQDLGRRLPAAIAAFTPWPTPASRAAQMDVAFVTTDLSRQTMATCGAAARSGWLLARDPTGAVPAAAAKAGMLADGCINVGEEADLLATALRSRGARVTSLDLHADGSNHGAFAASDQALVLAEIRRMLAAPSSSG